MPELKSQFPNQVPQSSDQLDPATSTHQNGEVNGEAPSCPLLCPLPVTNSWQGDGSLLAGSPSHPATVPKAAYPSNVPDSATAYTATTAASTGIAATGATGYVQHQTEPMVVQSAVPSLPESPTSLPTVIRPIAPAPTPEELIEERSRRQTIRWGAIALAAAAAALTWQLWEFTQQQRGLRVAESSLNQTVPLAQGLAETSTDRPSLAVPPGWRTTITPNGAIAYVPPTNEAVTIQPELPALDASTGQVLDGTRYPYVTELSANDLLSQPIAPGKYEWNGIWEGEGYTRELTAEERLVAEREGGDNVLLNVFYDETITDPQQPNFIITIDNQQSTTGQLTNLSAFLLNEATGQTIERRDFEQLSPYYDVTLTRNSGFGGAETKTLEPLGTTTFAFHVKKAELDRFFPLKLQADNQLFNERLQEIYQLEAQGWIVKEVPPPGA